ncbi:MAG: succinate dehydrogenase iron-sulfur subunit [Candidatus Zixiibacteriota bacterium]|nr:MAG: succinate dehydrogenase iron-sulfur subunit [candidate division Zixibacteria bacterium]
MQYTLRVYRYDPESGQPGRLVDYTVELEKGATVLDALGEIKAHQDGSLVYRRSCRSGICGSCAMKINGFNRLACETQVESLGRKPIHVEPLPGFKPIKDLVVDLEPFWNNLHRTLPWLINPNPPPTDKERPQSPEEFAWLEMPMTCILCASCTSSCPSFWADRTYLGPAALNKAFRYEFDTRDQGFGQRRDTLDNRHGLWRCHTIMNCNDCCPKHIRITEEISWLKRKVVEEKY